MNKTFWGCFLICLSVACVLLGYGLFGITVSDKDNQIGNLTTQNEQLIARLDVLTVENTTNENKLNEFELSLNEKENTLSQKQQTIEELEEDIQVLQKSDAEKSAMITEKQTKIEELEVEVESLQNSNEDKAEEICL